MCHQCPVIARCAEDAQRTSPERRQGVVLAGVRYDRDGQPSQPPSDKAIAALTEVARIVRPLPVEARVEHDYVESRMGS
jgi:hypothetical protein